MTHSFVPGGGSDVGQDRVMGFCSRLSMTRFGHRCARPFTSSSDRTPLLLKSAWRRFGKLTQFSDWMPLLRKYLAHAHSRWDYEEGRWGEGGGGCAVSEQRGRRHSSGPRTHTHTRARVARTGSQGLTCWRCAV